MKKILFLCTGNYYRSRFAEEYFNHHAEKFNWKWKAHSLGIMREFEGNGNVGPIAQNTLHKLEELNIKPKAADRMPDYVFEGHFEEYDRVIAVSVDEHKPMLEELWDMSSKEIEYFDVEDLHIEGPETALPRLVKRMDSLLSEFK